MLILIIVLFLFNSISFSVNPPVYAEGEVTYFARVMFDSVFLYKTPDDSTDPINLYFELPKTYFVQLLDSANEDFYKAKYFDITGYVKKSCVQAIEGSPAHPFLDNISFRVYAEKSQMLMTEPSISTKTTTEILTIPILSKNIVYLGKIKGECLIEGRTDVWYYCKYSADKTYTGYVYSDFCDEMQNIIPNTEEVTFISNPTFEQEKTTASLDKNSNFVGIVVAMLTVPAIVFLVMILKGKSILSPSKSKEIKEY